MEYSKEREGWQKRLFSDKVRQDCGGPRTSRRTSAVFERNFFSCGEGRDGGCALWEGGPGPLKVEIFLQPSLTCWGLQKKQDVMVVVTLGRGVDLRPFLLLLSNELPTDQVYYENEEVGLKVAVCWSCAGTDSIA